MVFLQFPSMGHVFAFQQLLCYFVSFVDLDFFVMALLGYCNFDVTHAAVDSLSGRHTEA